MQKKVPKLLSNQRESLELFFKEYLPPSSKYLRNYRTSISYIFRTINLYTLYQYKCNVSFSELIAILKTQGYIIFRLYTPNAKLEYKKITGNNMQVISETSRKLELNSSETYINISATMIRKLRKTLQNQGSEEEKVFFEINNH